MMWFSKVSNNNQKSVINFSSKEAPTKNGTLTDIKYPKLLIVGSFYKRDDSSLFVKKLINKLQAIFFLNVSDILFTWFFIVKHHNLFIEINPFAKGIINDLPLSLFIKISIVLIVLAYLKYRIKSSNPKGLKLINITTNLIIAFYVAVNLLHLLNLIFLLTL